MIFEFEFEFDLDFKYVGARGNRTQRPRGWICSSVCLTCYPLNQEARSESDEFFPIYIYSEDGKRGG